MSIHLTYIEKMNRYLFEPNFKIVSSFQGLASIPELEQEVGMYSATPEFVLTHGGPLSKKIMQLVPDWYYKETKEKGLMPNIDIRIHRLYPGDFPAYPGWHCDGEFRETYFSQPDLDRINVSRHLICTLSSVEGGVSNPEFLNEPFEAQVIDPTPNHTLWEQVHQQLDQLALEKTLQTQTIDDGQLVLFDPWSLHRVRPARIRGWRLFFRMSQWHRPNLGNGGMLTKQEQVYKMVEGSGW